jgi:metal-responsive CopG/Arc/MetJ family transcriptional regulator
MLPRNTETTSVCIPTWLMEIIDDYCERNDMSRSSLIVRCIRKYMLLKYDNHAVWTHIYHSSRNPSCEDL